MIDTHQCFCDPVQLLSTPKLKPFSCHSQAETVTLKCVPTLQNPSLQRPLFSKKVLDLRSCLISIVEIGNMRLEINSRWRLLWAVSKHLSPNSDSQFHRHLPATTQLRWDFAARSKILVSTKKKKCIVLFNQKAHLCRDGFWDVGAICASPSGIIFDRESCPKGLGVELVGGCQQRSTGLDRKVWCGVNRYRRKEYKWRVPGLKEQAVHT